MVGIYKITNIISNKVYIGQSINIEKRWSAHRTRPFNTKSTQYNSPLYRAIRKYGLSAFTFEVIEECLPSLLDQKEQFYIQLYKSNDLNFGYNLTAGGQTATTTSKISKMELEAIYNLLLQTNLTEEEIALRFNVSQRFISGINLGQYHIIPGFTYPLRKKQTFICQDCGKEITRGSTRCIACSNRFKNKSRSFSTKPSREVLKKEIRTIPFTQLGKKYGVSDKAIVKWCISYNLPSKKSEIKSYTDEQWSKI